MRDSSLEDFLDPGGGDAVEDGERDDGEHENGEREGAEAGGGGAVDAVPDAGAEATAVVEPAVATADWTPAGAPCAACGERVERRWRDDGDLVCSNCKAW